MHRLLPLAALLVPAALFAQAPDSEIHLAPLRVEGGVLRLGAPVNVTNRPGYDNQPSFTPDGAAILFTSDRSRIVTAPVEGAPPRPRGPTSIATTSPRSGSRR